MEEAWIMSENPDQEAIIESLKSICNVMLHNETGLVGLLCLWPGRTEGGMANLRALFSADDRQRQQNSS